MSFYDLSTLSNEELIAQFIIESKDSGCSLSYSDYEIIDRWLYKAQNDVDLILLLLYEEIQSDVPTIKKEKPKFKSLKALEKKILVRIKDAKKKL